MRLMIGATFMKLARALAIIRIFNLLLMDGLRTAESLAAIGTNDAFHFANDVA